MDTLKIFSRHPALTEILQEFIKSATEAIKFQTLKVAVQRGSRIPHHRNTYWDYKETDLIYLVRLTIRACTFVDIYNADSKSNRKNALKYTVMCQYK